MPNLTKCRGFSLREYLEQEHAADGVKVDQRMNIAALWCQRNRHRSLREFITR